MGGMAKDAVDDLVLISEISEAAIVENLKKRYDQDLIYTNIGPVLVSVNPFRWIKGLCDDEQVEEYRGRFRHELRPNVFALAEEAYRNMKNELESQCVIITGESGAGKTEAAKLIMKYVAAVSGEGASQIDYVKRVILDSNPLLEAFGNAKTLRNNNSSRFGKYFDIQFNRLGEPCGGKITHYLLEKSRVVGQLKGERNFHIFYQLLNGATDQEAREFQLSEPQNFTYLANSECFTVDSMDDSEEFAEVRNAMNTLEIPPADQKNAFRIISAILHLGNIKFKENAKSEAVVEDEKPIQSSASLFGVNFAALKNAILFRIVTTGGSSYNVPNNLVQAISARDALSKTVYSRLFDWVVQKTNDALSKFNLTFACVIGVLDIYGFEIFDNNGFEQFCINYVNEKLQQYFIEETLKKEQDEYKEEGIAWTPIKFFNNKTVCDLIEAKKPPGIFSVLDDICATMHAENAAASDNKFLDKAAQFFGSHLHFKKFNKGFEIKHYAGPVSYDVAGFCFKNKDPVVNDLIECMQSSNMKFLIDMFPEDTKDKEHAKRPTTVGFKIRTSAGKLMETLSQCFPHYIRCIKPNETKQPKDWNEGRVKHQVQYLGLLENIRVCRAGYCYRAPFERFLKRYKKLSKKTWGSWGEWSGPPKDGCTTILGESSLGKEQWQLGKSKVFIRHPESLFYLEECLERYDYECANTIQKAWRRWKAKKHSLEQRAQAASLFRGKKERRRESINRKFTADYMNYEENFSLQEGLGKYTEEPCVFASQIIKLNRRGRPERRDLVLTTQAWYILMRCSKGGKSYYKLTRRCTLDKVSSVSFSTLQDGWTVIHVSSEYDIAFELENKTEFATIMDEFKQHNFKSGLSLNFSDNITYKIKSGDTRILNFQKDSAVTNPVLKKNGKTLTISVPPGQDKNTDTTPQNLNVGKIAKPKGSGAKKAPASSASGAKKGGAAPRAAVQETAPAAAHVQPAGPKKTAGAPKKGAAPKKTAAPKKPAHPQARALYDYAGQTDEELSFQEGDIVTIIKKDPGGWWEGELSGRKGWVPANYLEEI
eukprot:TRINITY_DN5718_c0_g1_i1.p1 TRINITY_DN5718_c0_g1~~TRINITY_DN5718_c0_g1_i1.p1  ORF type:complete len:1049 (-),score=243.18 TRINITY_DN5718_c0_g1_i1:114-3260(-)